MYRIQILHNSVFFSFQKFAILLNIAVAYITKSQNKLSRHLMPIMRTLMFLEIKLLRIVLDDPRLSLS